ncbi:MAG: protease HtpX, partial [Alphaproteobacteria bacterium]
MRTTILLAALTGLILAIGGLLGGREGMVMALGMAAAMNFGSYWFSDQIVLRSYGAQPVTAEQAPELLALVSDLAEKAGLPKTPSVYVLPDDGMNAFATGR